MRLATPFETPVLNNKVLAKIMGVRGVSPACNENAGKRPAYSEKPGLPVGRQEGFA